jgi:tRNA threonylcarbamoyladenosine biosynthesis protein TsaE
MEMEYGRDEIGLPAARLLDLLKQKRIIALHGEMGAGKTTLVKEVCFQDGSKDVVSSPTFSLINQYLNDKGEVIYHIDLYRIRNVVEAMEAGVLDCLLSGHFCLVEWPELAPELFPQGTVHVQIESLHDNRRKLKINL